MGILQIWAYNFGEIELGKRWSSILKRVSQCKAATKAVIEYLLSFHGEVPSNIGEVKLLLEEHLASLTTSTVCMLASDKFWKHSVSDQLVALKGSFTVNDRFGGNPGNITHLTAVLKSPASLSEVWLRATIR